MIDGGLEAYPSGRREVMASHIDPAPNMLLLLHLVCLALFALVRGLFLGRLESQRLRLRLVERHQYLLQSALAYMPPQHVCAHPTDLGVHEHSAAFGVGVVKELFGIGIPALADKHGAAALLL